MKNDRRKWLFVRTLICAVSLAAACFYGSSTVQAAPRAQETGERITIVIDPGHGGENEGTLENGFCEKKMTLTTALAMYDELSKYDNVDVYLTRMDDRDVDFAERAQIAEDHNADFLFSIHYNASADHRLYGSEVWISSEQPYNAYGYQFGWEQMNEMRDMGLFLRGVKTKRNGKNTADYYAIIRECTARSIPSAIIEHCHVDEVRDVPYCDTEEDWKAFGRADARAVASYFGLDGENDDLPEVSLQSILPVTVRDQTEPDVCTVALQSADYDTGEVVLSVTATDYDCPMMYYDYSTDGGQTYSELFPWPELDIMNGSFPDTFTFSLSFTAGEQPVISVRVYNQADLFTESEPITFPQAFVNLAKLEEAARQESIAAEEAARASEEAAKENTIDSKPANADAVSTQAPAKEINFGVFLSICVVLLVLLLLTFLLYQLQLARHRKRRRQARKDSGNRRNHPR